MDLLFGLVFPIVLPLLVLASMGYGLVWGLVRRKRTVSWLATEEPRLVHLFCVNIEQIEHHGQVSLVLGNVAYAADAPSRLATVWRTLIGGRADSLTFQADLARRIAIVRMLQQAEAAQAIGVTNVRIETSEIFSGSGERSRLVIELLAYGNALIPAPAAT